ncbi:MAG: hypothetical protein LKE47_09410 [Prevotella sp.]|jgi:hypothetical protein|nr:MULTISPECIES: nucleoporin [unclassified Prevotella]MCH3970586.1 hypothetical protein [Prevotella sp.]MCH4018047.1 hypothetical protein [Prevotella sp.]MCH4100759.1 hypothetical protein [Prevotella sp.]MCH4186961.1 hypothetical protein [Prevotella sp.]MCI1323989.1 hypothetical protein [Prevotella sp.]
MKKLIIALVALFTFTGTINAMSYDQAKDQALFLTDKMAYELNLTDEQYEAAYEINLDYLMSIDNYDDLYGSYWRQRNMDLSYILLDWQYNNYLNDLYFYRPLYWDGDYWHFRIYARYPHRNYYYFGSPTFIVNYRGGHSWRDNGGRSWYRGRDFGGRSYNRNEMGMRDAFNRGDYGQGRVFGNMNTRNAGYQDNGSFGSMNQDQSNRTHHNGMFGRQSSTRTTVRNNSGSMFGSGRSFRESNSSPSQTFSPRSNSSSNSFFGSSRSRGNTSSSSSNHSSFGGRSFGSSHESTRSAGGSGSSHGSFGGGHSSGSSNGGAFGGHH